MFAPRYELVDRRRLCGDVELVPKRNRQERIDPSVGRVHQDHRLRARREVAKRRFERGELDVVAEIDDQLANGG